MQDLVLDNVKSRVLGTTTFLMFVFLLFWKTQMALFPQTSPLRDYFPSQVMDISTLKIDSSRAVPMTFSVRGDSSFVDGFAYDVSPVLWSPQLISSPFALGDDGSDLVVAANTKDFNEWRYREIQPRLITFPENPVSKQGIVEFSVALISADPKMEVGLRFERAVEVESSPLLFTVAVESEVASVSIASADFIHMRGTIRGSIGPIRVRVTDALDQPLEGKLVIAVSESLTNDYSPRSDKLSLLEDAIGLTDANGTATLEPFISASNSRDLFLSFFCDGVWGVWEGEMKDVPLKIENPPQRPLQVVVMEMPAKGVVNTWLPTVTVKVVYPSNFTEEHPAYPRYAYAELVSINGVELYEGMNPYGDTTAIFSAVAPIGSGGHAYFDDLILRGPPGEYLLMFTSDGVESSPETITLTTDLNYVTIFPEYCTLYQSETGSILAVGADGESRGTPYVRVGYIDSDVIPAPSLGGRRVSLVANSSEAYVNQVVWTNDDGIAGLHGTQIIPRASNITEITIYADVEGLHSPPIVVRFNVTSTCNLRTEAMVYPHKFTPLSGKHNGSAVLAEMIPFEPFFFGFQRLDFPEDECAKSHSYVASVIFSRTRLDPLDPLILKKRDSKFLAEDCAFDATGYCRIEVQPYDASGVFFVYALILADDTPNLDRPDLPLVGVLSLIADCDWVVVVDPIVSAVEAVGTPLDHFDVINTLHFEELPPMDMMDMECWPQPVNCGVKHFIPPVMDIFVPHQICGMGVQCTAEMLTVSIHDRHCPQVAPPYSWRVTIGDHFLENIPAVVSVTATGGVVDLSRSPSFEALFSGDPHPTSRGLDYHSVLMPVEDGVVRDLSPLKVRPQFPGRYTAVCSVEGVRVVVALETESLVTGLRITDTEGLSKTLGDAKSAPFDAETSVFAIQAEFSFVDGVEDRTGYKYEVFAIPVEDDDMAGDPNTGLSLPRKAALLLSYTLLSATSDPSDATGSAVADEIHFHNSQNGECYHIVLAYAHGESFVVYSNSTSCSIEGSGCPVVCVQHQTTCSVVAAPQSVTIGNALGGRNAPTVRATSNMRDLPGFSASIIVSIDAVAYQRDGQWYTGNFNDHLIGRDELIGPSQTAEFDRLSFPGPVGTYALQFRAAGELCGMHIGTGVLNTFLVEVVDKVEELEIIDFEKKEFEVDAFLPVISVFAKGGTGFVPDQMITCTLVAGPSGGELTSLSQRDIDGGISARTSAAGVANFELVMTLGPTGNYTIAFSTGVKGGISTTIELFFYNKIDAVLVLEEPIKNAEVLLGEPLFVHYTLRAVDAMGNGVGGYFLSVVGGVKINGGLPGTFTNEEGYVSIDSVLFEKSNALTKDVRLQFDCNGIVSNHTSSIITVRNQFMIDISEAFEYEAVMWLSLVFWAPIFAFNVNTPPKRIKRAIYVLSAASVGAIIERMIAISNEYSELVRPTTPTKMLYALMMLSLITMFILLSREALGALDRRFKLFKGATEYGWEKKTYEQVRLNAYTDHVRQLLLTKSKQPPQPRHNRLSRAWDKMWRVELSPQLGMRVALYREDEPRPVFFFPQRLIYGLSLSLCVLILGVGMWSYIEVRAIESLLQVRASAVIFTARLDHAKVKFTSEGLHWVLELLEAAKAYFPITVFARTITDVVDLLEGYLHFIFRFSVTVSFAVSGFNLFALARLYRLRVLLMRRGRQNFLRKPTMSPHLAAKFVMFQTMYTVVGFFVTSSLFALVAALLILFVVSSPFRLIVTNAAVQVLVGVSSGSALVTLISRVICSYFLVDRKTDLIIHRYMFALFDSFWLFVSLLTGLVSSIARYPLLLLSIALFQARSDFSFLPLAMETFDSAFTAYCSTLVTDYSYNHPICSVFCSWMDTIRRERRDHLREQQQQQSAKVTALDRDGDMDLPLCHVTEKDGLAQGGRHFENSTPENGIRQDSQKRVRNYLWLLVTLHNNPRVRRYRRFVPNDNVIADVLRGDGEDHSDIELQRA